MSRAFGRQHAASLAGAERTFKPVQTASIPRLRASSSAAIPAAVDAAVRSPGKALDRRTRADFEARFGHDFSRVRVHTDSSATSAAGALSARAFTAGENVVFAAGRYAPETAAGRHLLGHELAHVVQQRRGAAVLRSAAEAANLESHAERAANALSGGGPVEVRGEAAGGVQRNAEAYVWNPHVDGYGHAALKLCDGTYLSWWPSGGGDKKDQIWGGRPGGPHSYADDIGPGGEDQSPDAVYGLGCNCLDENAMKSWYKANFGGNPNATWGVLRHSCSDVARQAINEGSSAVNPCYLSISHTNLFWTPKDLGLYAECQSRWCESKAAGALPATTRYLWEEVKELSGGALINTLKSLWWKSEIAAKAATKG